MITVAQEWLDKEYSFEQRNKIKGVLHFSQECLKGSLELRGFMQLESLNCSENNLTYLDVSECYKLVFLDCSSNQLTSLKLPSNSKLSCVIARNNNLLSVDLSLFSGMTNLKSLDIGNTSFYGSLEPLKDLKLEELWIDNTEVSNGLEYLFVSDLKKFCCTSKSGFKKVKEIERELENFKIGYNEYDWIEWRKNTEKIKLQKELDSARDEIKRLEIRIKNLEKESFHKNGDELEEKIEELNKLKLEYDNLWSRLKNLTEKCEEKLKVEISLLEEKEKTELEKLKREESRLQKLVDTKGKKEKESELKDVKEKVKLLERFLDLRKEIQNQIEQLNYI